MPKKALPPTDLQQAVDRLTTALERAPKSYRYLLHPWYVFWSSVLRGIGYSVGLLVAIAVVIPFLITLLHSVNWVPVIGDFVSEVAVRIDQAQTITQSAE